MEGIFKLWRALQFPMQVNGCNWVYFETMQMSCNLTGFEILFGE